MEMSPTVSVLIVSQAQRAALEATLASLEAAYVPATEETPPLFETIVVDCASPDGSGRLDEHFEKATFMRLQKNFGWTRAFNIGTRTAKGQYLFCLPPGLTVEPGTIARLVDALRADAAAGAVCPRTEGATYFALPRPGEAELRVVPAADAEYPFGQPVLYPKLALTSINYFQEKSYGQFYADLELFHKMKEAAKRVKILEDVRLGGHATPTPSIDPEIAEADRLHGLATFYGKNFGFFSGFGFWLGQTLGAALRFRLGLASKLASGTKVDGL
jgi:glycosyltransferase involved in cell wall biosynthesis